MRISIFGCTLLLVCSATFNVASAQQVTENFSVTVDTVVGGNAALQQALFGLTGSGTFTYDPAALTGANFETISVDQGLTLQLNVFGQTFTELDDRDFDPVGNNSFPALSFNNGQPFNLSFRVLESGFTSNPTDIQLSGVDFFEFNSLLSTNDGGDFETTLLVLASVPEPASSTVLTIGALMAFCRRRRVAG